MGGGRPVGEAGGRVHCAAYLIGLMFYRRFKKGVYARGIAVKHSAEARESK